MSKRTFWTTALMVMAGVAFPLYAQEPGQGAARLEIIKWTLIAASFPLGIAAAFGALGQGKAIAAAAEAIARNPSATGDIRGALILGLVLIESLVIYVLLNLLYLYAMPVASLAALDGRLTDIVAERLFGFVAGNVLALFSLVSIAAGISDGSALSILHRHFERAGAGFTRDDQEEQVTKFHLSS